MVIVGQVVRHQEVSEPGSASRAVSGAVPRPVAALKLRALAAAARSDDVAYPLVCSPCVLAAALHHDGTFRVYPINEKGRLSPGILRALGF